MTIAYDAPPALEVQQRDQFPGDRCPGSNCPDNAQPKASSDDDRGSGRLAWYRVAAGGRVNGEFVMAWFNTQVETGGFFGHGLRDRLNTAAADLHPGLEVLDYQPMVSPPIG